MSNNPPTRLSREETIAKIRDTFSRYAELYGLLTKNIGQDKAPEGLSHIHMTLDVLRQSFEQNVSHLDEAKLMSFKENTRLALFKLKECVELNQSGLESRPNVQDNFVRAIADERTKVKQEYSPKKQLFVKLTFSSEADALVFKDAFSGAHTAMTEDGKTLILGKRRAWHTLFNLNLSSCLEILSTLSSDIQIVKSHTIPTERLRALAGRGCSGVELDVDAAQPKEIVLNLYFVSPEEAQAFQKQYAGSEATLVGKTIILHQSGIEKIFGRYRFSNEQTLLEVLRDELKNAPPDALPSLNRLFLKKYQDPENLKLIRGEFVSKRNSVISILEVLRNEVMSQLLKHIESRTKALKEIKDSLANARSPLSRPKGIQKLERTVESAKKYLGKALRSIDQFQKMARLFEHLSEPTSRHTKKVQANACQVGFVEKVSNIELFEKVITMSNAPHRRPGVLVGSLKEVIKVIPENKKILIGTVVNPYQIGGNHYLDFEQETSLIYSTDLYPLMPLQYPDTASMQSEIHPYPCHTGLARIGYSYRIDRVDLYDIDAAQQDLIRENLSVATLMAPDFDLTQQGEKLRQRLELARYCNQEGRSEYVQFIGMQVRLLCEQALAAETKVIISEPIGCDFRHNNPFLVATIFKCILSETRYKEIDFKFVIPESKENEVNIATIFETIMHMKKPEADLILQNALPFEELHIESAKDIDLIIRNASSNAGLTPEFTLAYQGLSENLIEYYLHQILPRDER